MKERVMSPMPMVDKCLEVAVEARRVPGVIATVGNADGVLYEGAFGERSLDAGVPMTNDTVVWIASMTKAITGAVAMQQVERGRLSLDAAASEVCPYLGEVQVLGGFTSEGAPKLRPPKRPVTLRHLLTHTAGFSYEIWNADYVTYLERTGAPSIFGCVNKGLEMPLVFDPGDRWEYGINIDWVGKMVEAVTGKDLDTVMRTEIFEPLGMDSTGFKISASQRERIAEVHLRGPDGLTHLGFEMPQEPEFWMGGGGLYSTVGDYLRFTRMILRGGELDGHRVIKAETVAEMSRNNMGDCNVTTAVSVHPFSNDANFYPAMTQKWGLTFLINTEDTPEGRSAGSLAWAGLANSYFWIDPVKDVTGVMATQVFPFADIEAFPLFKEFESAVYASI
jgi:CubicO group peptidase (beta-lactamase class C family)